MAYDVATQPDICIGDTNAYVGLNLDIAFQQRLTQENYRIPSSQIAIPKDIN